MYCKRMSERYAVSCIKEDQHTELLLRRINQVRFLLAEKTFVLDYMCSCR